MSCWWSDGEMMSGHPAAKRLRAAWKTFWMSSVLICCALLKKAVLMTLVWVGGTKMLQADGKSLQKPWFLWHHRSSCCKMVCFMAKFALKDWEVNYLFWNMITPTRQTSLIWKIMFFYDIGYTQHHSKNVLCPIGGQLTPTGQSSTDGTVLRSVNNTVITWAVMGCVSPGRRPAQSRCCSSLPASGTARSAAARLQSNTNNTNNNSLHLHTFITTYYSLQPQTNTQK